MTQIIELKLCPESASDDAFIQSAIAKKLTLNPSDFHFRFKRRSIDARKKKILVVCLIEVCMNDDEVVNNKEQYRASKIDSNKEITIIGAGPAGLFAALKAIQSGIKPIIYERGKNVQERRRDIAALNKKSLVNPESNYCFGEGGAGTYSDGKLYTRSKKRGDVETVLKWFVHFGANENILIDTHPHIGTNKLPNIIQNIREEIIKSGGEIHFEKKLTDIILDNQKVKAIELNNSKKIECDNLILATGHSARDIYSLLHEKGILIKAKPFALGVRVEHQQELIDKIQYSGRLNDEFLPPASYSLVTQIDGQGVYSFCMCPGGIIAPCATDLEEVVTNGWSPSKRNNPYANSGIVVSVDPEKLPSKSPGSPFVGLEFQKAIEKKCWEQAGKSQKVPAQRLVDFINGKKSKDFPRSSYLPGIISVDINALLPNFITYRLKKAFVEFDKKMKGFLTNDAVIHAPESRTSSPIQIPRNRDTLEHVEIQGLYPCAEGAGYAGGIVSAAIDGIKCMEVLSQKINSL